MGKSISIVLWRLSVRHHWPKNATSSWPRPKKSPSRARAAVMARATMTPVGPFSASRLSTSSTAVNVVALREINRAMRTVVTYEGGARTLSLALTALFFALELAGVHAESLLLTGANVHTVSGETLSPGQVLVENAKIAGVGNALASPGAKVIDLSGQHLYPGLIALNTTLGLTEISAVRATLDTTEPGEYTPDVESWIAVNPDSELIPVTRVNGIAFFEPVPEGGIVPGQSGLVTVEGWTTDQRTIKKPLSLHVFWPAMELNASPRPRGRGAPGQPKSLEEQAKERRAKIRATEDFFEEARAYVRAKEAAAE